MPDETFSRRSALARMAGFIGLTLVPLDSPTAEPFPHPEPRPGITSDNVLPEEKLPDKKRVREGFAAAREHPEIFDGIYCPCECSKQHRSLLSCFESAQPTGCYGCLETAELVSKQIKEGKTLVEIRALIDKKWG